MPIYEYRCETCQEVFEVLQNRNDPPPQHAVCGGNRVQRLLSRSSFVLKGDGWYATDYASKKPTAAKSATTAANDNGASPPPSTTTATTTKPTS